MSVWLGWPCVYRTSVLDGTMRQRCAARRQAQGMSLVLGATTPNMSEIATRLLS